MTVNERLAIEDLCNGDVDRTEYSEHVYLIRLSALST